MSYAAPQVLAKAVCDWQPLDTHFNSAFYKQLLDHPLDLTDLEAVDQELHKNLRWIQVCQQCELCVLSFSLLARLLRCTSRTLFFLWYRTTT